MGMVIHCKPHMEVMEVELSWTMPIDILDTTNQLLPTRVLHSSIRIAQQSIWLLLDWNEALLWWLGLWLLG